MKYITAPIAVLDSGIGGIGVLRELKKALPGESFLYFGDSANAPYGEKTAEEILKIVFSRAARLACRAKALVLACNTATAAAAKELRAKLPIPVIGMEPAVRPALRVCPHPRVLVLATKATLEGAKFRALMQKTPDAEIIALAAPGIVRLVEAGTLTGAAPRAYLAELLAPYRGIRFDAVVLGCTHFPFLTAELRRALDYPVPFFDGAAGTARETARRLAAAGLLRGSSAARGPCPDGFESHDRFFDETRRLNNFPDFVWETVPDPAARLPACRSVARIPDPCPAAWATGRILLSGSNPAALPLMKRLLFETS